MLVPEIEIIVTKDGAEILRKTVRPGDYVIGREPGCEVQLDVELVSRRHAQLVVNFDHALIEDLGSSNGTFVNGEPVTGRTRLWPNQKIQVGAATIELRRLKSMAPPDISLAPQTVAMQRLLPEEFLRDRKYDIGKVVARGGMGAILDAREATTERRVAMKVMLDGSSPDDLSRFIAEAKVTAQLEHPSIVPVYELSIDESGQPFYTMKMVRGITLRKVLELLARGVPETGKKYPLPALLTIFQKVCDAMAFAHSRGVIHRDLKPENIMLDDFGVVLVMDWGLAKVIGQKDAPDGDAGRSAVRTLAIEASGATLAGTVMGTPQYMSPEQARGEVETLDALSDIYALGAILYHILALRPPVSGHTAMEIVDKVGRGEVEPLDAGRVSSRAKAAPRVPDGLAAVVRKAMAFDKAQRFPRVADLQRDIESYQNGRATSAENAGFGKQVVLLVKRHKALFGTATAAWLIVTTLAVWFVVKITASEQRARNTLGQLRATAPTFFEQARLLTEQEKLPEALDKIGVALALDPNEPGFHAQRGNILQSLERFAEAAEAYAAALRLNPREPNAAANLELSRTLAAAKEKNGALSINARMEWRDALAAQRRSAEAILAGEGTTTDAAKMLPAWQAKIDAWLGKKAPRLQLTSNGLYDLDLADLSLTDLSPLRGMPLQSLVIDRNPHLKDLSPLADCPLIYLHANEIPDLVDLSPLKGKKLKTLQVASTGIRDLLPLSGIQTLEYLSIAYTAVSDLTPIRESKLKRFIASGSKVHSLEPLRGQPLEDLSISNTLVTSLAPIGDSPLGSLYIANCGSLDLAVLRTRHLHQLWADGTRLDHLEVLAEMTALEGIALPSNLTDPGILRGLRNLRKIDIHGSAKGSDALKDAADFWKEYDARKAAGKK